MKLQQLHFFQIATLFLICRPIGSSSPAKQQFKKGSCKLSAKQICLIQVRLPALPAHPMRLEAAPGGIAAQAQEVTAAHAPAVAATLRLVSFNNR